MKIIKVESNKITRRFTFQLPEGDITRAALIERPDKTILCISSQIGCTGTCKFCSSRSTPLTKNLSYTEMLSMLILTNILGTKPLLISFMGTGEPMANLNSIIPLINYLKQQDPSIRFALSTSGYNLDALHQVPSYVKIQFTIISPFPGIQKYYIPHGQSLSDIAQAIKNWSGEKETNTPLIKDVNDDQGSMTALAKWTKAIPVHAKLNYFHTMFNLEASNKASGCLNIMKSLGADVELYRTDGEEINAACGQFELA